MSSQDFMKFMEKKNNQIKNLQQKQKSVDFNAYNYDIEELAAILNFENFPLNSGKIKRRIVEMKRKFPNQPKYLKFFDECQKRLLDDFDNQNQQTWSEPYERESSAAGKVLERQYQSQNETQVKNQISQIINAEKDIIGIARQPQSENYMPKNVVQGQKNPFLITEIQRVVNFDSHYRKFLNPVSSSCPDLQQNKSQRLYTSSNYTVDLNQPLTNVVSITLDSVEIPNSWYTFSSDYGTNQLILYWNNGTTTEYAITIQNGNYSQQGLMLAINQAIFDFKTSGGFYPFRGYYDISGNFTASVVNSDPAYNPFPLIEFTYNSFNNKVYVNNYSFVLGSTGTGGGASCFWYQAKNNIGNVCAAQQESQTPRPGGKIDYNLGWLLGFRSIESRVHQTTYDSSGCRWESNISAISGASRTPPGGQTGGAPETFPANFGVVTTDVTYIGYTVPLSTLDIKGSQYFIITLDDFNNNKPNKDMISLIDTVDTQLKLPSYVNSQTMDSNYGVGKYELGYEGIPGYECVDVADVGNNERQCSTNDLNIDFLNLFLNNTFPVSHDNFDTSRCEAR